MGKNERIICTVEFECTEGSAPFEKRVLTIKPDTELVVGRNGSKHSNRIEETLVFNTPVISRKHAKLFLQNGKLYLMELNSNNGTYVNEKKISNKAKDPNSRQLENGHELKTGDIVRFSTLRKMRDSGAVIAPIVGRLTVTMVEDTTVPPIEPEKEIIQSYTIPDGPKLVEQKRREARQSTTPKQSPPKCETRQWSTLQPAKTDQRGTLTDSIETTTNESQTVQPVEVNDRQLNYYDQWQNTAQEFAVYRRKTLLLIVICLLVAFLYQLVANGFGATLSSIHRRQFKI